MMSTNLAELEKQIAAARDAAECLPTLRAQAVRLTTEIAALDDEIAGAQDRIRWAEEAASVLSCPNCDCRVVLRDGELAPVDPEITDMALSEADLQKAREALAKATERRQKAVAERDAAYKGIAQAIRAKAQLPALMRQLAALTEDEEQSS